MIAMTQRSGPWTTLGTLNAEEMPKGIIMAS